MNNIKRSVITAIFVIGMCVLAIAPALAGDPMSNNGYIYYKDGTPVDTNTTTNFDFTMNISNMNKSLGYWVPPQYGTNDTAYSMNGLTTGWDVNKNCYNYDTQTPEGMAVGDVLEHVVCDGSLCNTTYHTVTNQECIYGCIYFDVYLPSQSGIANHVVISEVYADAVDETDSEWIELYNPTNTAINIAEWTINTVSYQSDAKLPTGAEIPAHEFYLIGDAGWNPDNSSWPTTPDHSEEITLNNDNGWVQLNDSTGTVIDTLGWGSATTNETLAYPTDPPQNQSLQRKINDTLEQNGYGPAWDTNNNSDDFFIQANPNPQNSSAAPVPPIAELNTLILFSMGVIALAGYVLLKRRPE